jgi:hypothetical protein
VIDLGIGRQIVETDAKMVVQAITTDDFDNAVVGLLIAEIKTLASSCFISFECLFKGRDCNQAAHELAVEKEEKFTSSIPESVCVTVAYDLLAVE